MPDDGTEHTAPALPDSATASTNGSSDDAMVYGPAIRACVRELLLRDRGVSISGNLLLEIDGDGRVASLRLPAPLRGLSVDSCLQRASLGWRFAPGAPRSLPIHLVNAGGGP